MKIVYTGEEMPETITSSIFLAGPSLRPGQEKEMESWRNDAIQILKDKGFDGVIFCPENKDGKFDKDFSYDDQIDWEHKHLNLADCIVFWVPRDVSLDKNDQLKLPAFTTNVEWGAWADSGKVVFGCPPDLKERKNKYLKYYADFYNVEGGTTLTETLDAALDMLGEGDGRTEGERYVPLFIWKTPSFQSWYLSQKEAGNRLDHAELLWSFRPGNKKFVYAWVLKVDIFVESENRNKTNEFVLARTDISSVCLYHKSGDWGDSKDYKVILIKEFRSPANTKDGFVRELPGGSSASDENEEPKEIAAHEVYEETSFHIDPERLKFHGARQLAGTFSSHKSYLYSAELTEEELKWFESQEGTVHGNVEDSEKTFIEIHSINDLIKKELTDWTTIGQILSVVL
jgi:8-oxo-dGTP pyrophosphatase MutT (NUDIX family)